MKKDTQVIVTAYVGENMEHALLYLGLKRKVLPGSQQEFLKSINILDIAAAVIAHATCLRVIADIRHTHAYARSTHACKLSTQTSSATTVGRCGCLLIKSFRA